MKLAVTGANGFLGSRILTYYREKYKTERDNVVLGYTRTNLDITDKRQIFYVLEKDRPDFLVHTAAVSDIGICAKNPMVSEQINVEGVKNLADACVCLEIPLIFCSSDQVYMGSPEKEPHRETEQNLKPPTLYGQQKLRAEEYLLENHPNGIILRLSWMYALDTRFGLEHANLLSVLAQAIKTQQTVEYPVYDFRSLTSVWDVAKNIECLFHAEPGIYNFGSENNLSTYEAVQILLRQNGAEYLLKKNLEAFSECPRNLRMNMDKTKAAGILFPTTEEAFRKIKL